MSVDILNVFSSIFAYIAVMSLMLWTFIFAHELVVLTGKMNEIRHIESKISVNKLNLKSKIINRLNKITKSKFISSQPKKEISDIYNRMSELSFNQLDEFQLIFNYLQSASTLFDITPEGLLEIINLRSINEEGEVKGVLNLDNNFQNPLFWSKLYKYEMRILRLIFNIVTLNLELIAKVENYNDVCLKRSKTLSVPLAIQIDGFHLLRQIINKEDKAVAATEMAQLMSHEKVRQKSA